MSVKSLRNQLLAAIAMVLVATLALGSSTFAWFASNQEVQVKGMQVNTKVSDNLMIAYENVEASYSTKLLNQSRVAILEPASSVDGKAFFYHDTLNINGSGKVTAADYKAYDEDTELDHKAAGKSKYDNDFTANYGITDTITTANVEYGYIDYTFYLKATNSTDAAQSVNITQLDLKYNGNTTTEKAWRIAIFAQPIEAGATVNTIGNLITILKPAGAVNWTADKAVTEATLATALGDVEKHDADAVIANNNLAARSTQRYKVVVRLWLEGEDQTCNNTTYAQLTDDWTVELQIDLSSTTKAPVNKINSTAWVANAVPVIDDPNTTVPVNTVS